MSDIYLDIHFGVQQARKPRLAEQNHLELPSKGRAELKTSIFI
jgi:hypothetical protein